jgi:hypothetical protein
MSPHPHAAFHVPLLRGSSTTTSPGPSHLHLAKPSATANKLCTTGRLLMLSQTRFTNKSTLNGVSNLEPRSAARHRKAAKKSLN